MVEFFLDTASIEEINYYKKFGLVDGVTTNPALLAKEGYDPMERVAEIADTITGPVSVEVTYQNHNQMVKHAMKLNEISKNILIKLPASLEGLKSAIQLQEMGIKMNITLIFHPTQAIPFLKLDVDYTSLFIGRVEDFGLSNYEAVNQLKKMIYSMGSKTKLLSASIRNPCYLLGAINSGSDAITVPPSTWDKVFSNPLFHLGEKEFLETWSSLPFELRRKYETLED